MLMVLPKKISTCAAAMAAVVSAVLAMSHETQQVQNAVKVLARDIGAHCHHAATTEP